MPPNGTAETDGTDCSQVVTTTSAPKSALGMESTNPQEPAGAEEPAETPPVQVAAGCVPVAEHTKKVLTELTELTELTICLQAVASKPHLCVECANPDRPITKAVHWCQGPCRGLMHGMCGEALGDDQQNRTCSKCMMKP